MGSYLVAACRCGHDAGDEPDLRHQDKDADRNEGAAIARRLSGYGSAINDRTVWLEMASLTHLGGRVKLRHGR